jgi:hypothetical protein
LLRLSSCRHGAFTLKYPSTLTTLTPQKRESSILSSLTSMTGYRNLHILAKGRILPTSLLIMVSRIGSSLGINAPVIKIFNAQESMLGNPMGFGDTQFGVKVRLREQEGSRLPAISVVFYVEVPTGSTIKQTGSGLTDFWLYGVLQKSLTKRTKGRLNCGILFAGNSSTGLIGIQGRGQVFTGNGSLVRDFTPNLKLGVELFGGVTNNFNLSRGQLEAQFGGSYTLRDDFEFTFGVLGGRFPASPRIGVQVGFAYDFK